AGPVPVVLLKATGVPTGHSTVKALPVTLTGSLKLIVMLPSVARFVAPLIGTVVVTWGAASVLKLNTKLAAIVSGGSLASASVTWAATTVTVQVTPLGKLLVGLSTKLLAGPVPVVLLKATGVPTGHSSVNALAVTFT